MTTLCSWMQNRLFNIPSNLLQWCQHGSFEICLAQLKACVKAATVWGASLEEKRLNDNTTPLMDATQDKNVCAVIALLDAGADANIRRSWPPMLPLHTWLEVEPEDLAYPKGYFIALKKLIEATAKAAFLGTAITNHTLHRYSPSWKQKVDLMTDSHHHPIDVNEQDDSGKSLLLTWNCWAGLPGGYSIVAGQRRHNNHEGPFYGTENAEIGDDAY
jgi:hypothetical protein